MSRERDVARQEIAERLLAGHEGVGPAALHQSAAVERVARTAQRDEIVAVALLDAALDDDEEAVGRAVAADDRFVRAEIGDVERVADDPDFFGVSRSNGAFLASKCCAIRILPSWTMNCLLS